MPTTAVQRRSTLRHILSGAACANPASVFDPLSARLAERAGFQTAVLPGSIAAAVLLGAPDLVLPTLTEVVDLVRRITRYTDISLIVDADHGYGNALHVMRTVEEMEAVDVAGLTLEDTLLPEGFHGGAEGTVSTAEMVGKLKAAVRARRDPSLVIVGRTNALRSSTLGDALDRLKAYADAGVDAVMVVGVKTAAEVEAVHKAVRLPVVLGNVAANAPRELVDRTALAAMSVRLAYQGQAPFMAALKAADEAMRHLGNGGPVSVLTDRMATDDFFTTLLRRDVYSAMRKEFLT